ncbi:MAG: uroporphyrinogen decarboxylase family protein, partial [Coriobacteriia bacterium]
MQSRLPHRAALTFGLTFVPSDALVLVAPAATDHLGSLLAACGELDAAFAFVPWWERWSHRALRPLAEASVAPFAVFAGPLWPVLEERGITAGLLDTLLNPEQIAAELDVRLCEIEAGVRDAIDGGARAIVIAEDVAGSEGPLVAPDFAIGTLLPRLASVARLANEAGVPAILHSDGDIRSLLGAIKRAGFSAVHAGGGLGFDAFERLFWAARGDGLALVGGLQTVELAAGLARAEVLGSRVGLLARAGG